MRANDEPHGVFSLTPAQQSVVVVGSGSEVTRALVMNVTRLAGLFGNASVGYKISGGIDEVMDIEEILGGKAQGRLFLREGQTFSTITVPISNQVRKRMLFDTSTETLIQQIKTSVNDYRGTFFKFHSLYCFEVLICF